MKRLLLAAIGLAATVILGAGCESKAPTPTKVTSSAEAGPNKRIKYKEEYKKMLGKDGQLLWKPSESKKRPPGIPKS